MTKEKREREREKSKAVTDEQHASMRYGESDTASDDGAFDGGEQDLKAAEESSLAPGTSAKSKTPCESICALHIPTVIHTHPWLGLTPLAHFCWPFWAARTCQTVPVNAATPQCRNVVPVKPELACAQGRHTACRPGEEANTGK